MFSEMKDEEEHRCSLGFVWGVYISFVFLLGMVQGLTSLGLLRDSWGLAQGSELKGSDGEASGRGGSAESLKLVKYESVRAEGSGSRSLDGNHKKGPLSPESGEDDGVVNESSSFFLLQY